MFSVPNITDCFRGVIICGYLGYTTFFKNKIPKSQNHLGLNFFMNTKIMQNIIQHNHIAIYGRLLF